MSAIDGSTLMRRPSLMVSGSRSSACESDLARSRRLSRPAHVAAKRTPVRGEEDARILGPKALENHLLRVFAGSLTLPRGAHGPGQHRLPGHMRGWHRQIVHAVSDEIGARLRRVRENAQIETLLRGERVLLGAAVMALSDDAARELWGETSQPGHDVRIERHGGGSSRIVAEHLRDPRRQALLSIESALDLDHQGDASGDARRELGERD